MNAQERLRRAIDQQRDRLRAGVPGDRAGAILALLKARDRLPNAPAAERPPDLVTGRRLADPGGNLALRLCLEAAGDEPTDAPTASGDGWDGWAERFLRECGSLAEAEAALAHCETGFMRLVDDGAGAFDAWIATKRAPASWRERADVDWWAAWLRASHEPEPRARRAERPAPPAGDAGSEARHSRRLADVHLETMAWQFGYPDDAVIGGCAVRTFRAVLGWLVARAPRARARGEATEPRSESALVVAIASDLAIDPAEVGRAVAGFALDREGAAYHAAVPDVAAAPLVRVGPGRLAWSAYGLTTQPLLFLARELRRRAAADYHNAARLREDVFRRDLYALFRDKRFVTSAGRVVLRRERGDVRTDVDAVVFDRKTGALGLFELKSQDPFARSTAELARQRDNFLYANRQVSGALDWLNRHGADALLGRVDARAARTFRAHKVYPFVLGRCLARFDDGPEPDRRAAWGTWPQALRLRDGQPFRANDANPLGAFFAGLAGDAPLIRPPADLPAREIAVGAARLVVHPSYAAYTASAADARGRGADRGGRQEDRPG